MGTVAVHETSVSYNDVNTGDPESSMVDLAVDVSSNRETSGELGTAGEILTRVELDLACVSEKLVNLSVLMMHVSTKESEFEAFASAGKTSINAVAKALEFDLLCGILDSGAAELDMFISTLQIDVLEVLKIVSSFEESGEALMAIKEKLHDSEISLKQSQDQISEIWMLSSKFRRPLSYLHEEKIWNDDERSIFLEDGQSLNMSAKIDMQSAEQQRHILRMLEKSLAREMDLEKKLTESRQFEEELTRRLISVEQEVFFVEEEAIEICGRWFTAENASEVLMGISKELLEQLQNVQFNLTGSIQQEPELRSKLERSVEELESKESALQKFNSSSAKLNDFLVAQTDNLKVSLTEAEENLILANSEAFTLREKVSSLEKQLEESESQLSKAMVSVDGRKEDCTALQSEISEMECAIENLKEKLSKTESIADNAEARCKLLADTNMELNEELGHLKCASEKVGSLERQLRESDIRLQHAVASADASQEKQNLLYSTINDMENVIEDMKSKVSTAESRADSAEDKCIILSESNADLNEELSFLRARLECLEVSLNQAEETKMATARDIGLRTKVITDLVMQLAIERERLHKQISALVLENKFLAVKLQQPRMESSVAMEHRDRGHDEKVSSLEHEITEVSAADNELDKTLKNAFVDASKVAATDSIPARARRIGRGILNFKHVLMAMLIFLISAAVYFCLPQNHPI